MDLVKLLLTLCSLLEIIQQVHAKNPRGFGRTREGKETSRNHPRHRKKPRPISPKPKKTLKKKKGEDNKNHQKEHHYISHPKNYHGVALEDVRFNKCPAAYTSVAKHSEFYVEKVHKEIFPLLPKDYPVRGVTAHELKTETYGDSVVTEEDYALDGAKANEYLAMVKPPVFPNSDRRSEFWHQLEHVVDLQMARRKDVDPYSLHRWPDLWKKFRLEDVANAVKNEYPVSLQAEMIETLFKAGVKMDHQIMPFRSLRNTVGTQFLLAKLNTWAMEAVSPMGFRIKWDKGLPRPEEVAYLIAMKEYTAADGVPQGLIDKIHSMKLRNAHDFTAYEFGCPTHPSWPAMHAAGSTCSFWLPAVAHVTPEQYCEALRVDLAVAYARSVAGVHYKQDNFAGLNLGMQIIKEKFPKYMAEKYHSNEQKLRERLEHLSFDWEDFDAYKCTIAGVPVGQRLRYHW